MPDRPRRAHATLAVLALAGLWLAYLWGIWP